MKTKSRVLLMSIAVVISAIIIRYTDQRKSIRAGAMADKCFSEQGITLKDFAVDTFNKYGFAE